MSVFNAIDYVKNVCPDLWTYLDNGYVEPTNNAAERAVKPFVMQRKVFQTAGSYSGSKYTTIIFSIVQTARFNIINVENYLKYVLENPNFKSIEDLMAYSKNIKDLFTNK